MIAGFLWAAGLAYFAGAALSMRPEEVHIPTSAIVVVTGDEGRIETGLQVFEEFGGRVRYLFISGVHPSVTEGTIRQMWHSTETLPNCCIILGHAANTTIGNAQEVSAWARGKDFKSIRLVTSSYHMKRAALEFSYAMPGIKIIRNPVVEPNQVMFSKRFWNLIATEYNKYIVRYFSLLTGIKTIQ